MSGASPVTSPAPVQPRRAVRALVQTGGRAGGVDGERGVGGQAEAVEPDVARGGAPAGGHQQLVGGDLGAVLEHEGHGAAVRRRG
nr:hypothetical protein [Quadrisphaera sp. INWT6]